MPDIDLQLQHMAREDEEKHAKEAAKKYGLPYINLINYPFAPDVMAIIPENQSVSLGVVAYLKAEKTIRVATNNPQNEKLKNYLKAAATEKKSEFKISYCSNTSIKYALSMYTMLVPQVQQKKIEVTQEKEAKFEDEIRNIEDLKDKITKVSPTELLDEIIAGAIKIDATDTQLEPRETEFRVR